MGRSGVCALCAAQLPNCIKVMCPPKSVRVLRGQLNLSETRELRHGVTSRDTSDTVTPLSPAFEQVYGLPGTLQGRRARSERGGS